MTTQDLVQRYGTLLRGLDRAYGSYTLDGTVTPEGKRPGRAETV
jgi:hypothetical protein